MKTSPLFKSKTEEFEELMICHLLKTTKKINIIVFCPNDGYKMRVSIM